MVATWTTLFFFILTLTSINCVQIMFEQFRQCSSNGVIDCNLRVRKINRTTAALYGNATVRMDLGKNFKTWFDAYHSPLGNNQFNLYPMRVPPMGVCDYLERFWGDYYPYMVGYAPNLVKPGECPLSVRVVQLDDMILDPRMLPPYVPKGLWKLVWHANATGMDKYFLVELTFKVYPDGHI